VEELVTATSEDSEVSQEKLMERNAGMINKPCPEPETTMAVVLLLARETALSASIRKLLFRQQVKLMVKKDNKEHNLQEECALEEVSARVDRLPVLAEELLATDKNQAEAAVRLHPTKKQNRYLKVLRTMTITACQREAMAEHTEHLFHQHLKP